MSVEHALSCARGGFPTIRHNKVRDLTTNLLTEVCKDVRIETELQPVMPQQLSGATGNAQDGARLNISANGVWGGRLEKTYFDVRVLAPSNKFQPASKSMNERRNGRTNVFVKWSTPPSPHLLWQRQEVWEMRRQLSTSTLPQCSHRNGIHLTAPHYVGYNAVWPSLSYTAAIRGARSSQGHAARPPCAVDLVTSESKIPDDDL